MDSFGSRSTLRVGGHDYEIYRLDALDKQGVSTEHLPYSLRILLENLLRTEDGRNVTEKDIRALAAWGTKAAAGCRKKKLPSPPAACCCRILPACPRSSISRRCVTPCGSFPAIRR